MDFPGANYRRAGLGSQPSAGGHSGMSIAILAGVLHVNPIFSYARAALRMAQTLLLHIAH